MWGQVIFFNFAFMLIDGLLFRTLTLENLARYLFPLSTRQSWFVSIYILFYCIGPYMQKAVLWLREHKSQYSLLIGILFAFNGFVCLVSPMNSAYYSDLFFAIYAIMLGDYIALNEKQIQRLPLLPLFVCFAVLSIGSSIAMHYLTVKLPALTPLSWHFALYYMRLCASLWVA